ncbi:MAG TPA: RHS repeat-associated core domain-containing protein [Thermoanaerobaculia bacterium]|nr:RHS repeat-associated core domain-containing protein [Thermoanaerobaculia bacterium]
MIRRIFWAILVFVLAPLVLAQDRYHVTLRFDADDDPEAVTRQLAATYRLAVDPADIGAASISVTANEAAIGMLRNDRRVVAIEAARPGDVESHAAGFGDCAYDGAGYVTQVGSDTFAYDTRGRIRKAAMGGVEQTFTYDRWGNITKIATGGESDRTIAVDANNRLSGATYDDAGNLLSYHGGTFVYDALNVVKESTPTGGNRHLYLYSASNERIASIELVGAQQQSEWTIRDDTGKVLRRYRKSLSGAWSWEEDYVYRGSLLLAAEVPSSEKVRHFHLDHLGTPRLITGNGGAVIAERTYGAFGRGLSVESTPPPQERAQFTGHERDSFQLDYMHARYYDPMVGRFLAVDPTWKSADLRKPESWNRYSYVMNNPVNMTDPDGRSPFGLGLKHFELGMRFLTEYVLPDGDTPLFEAGYSREVSDKPNLERPAGSGAVITVGRKLAISSTQTLISQYRTMRNALVETLGRCGRPESQIQWRTGKFWFSV